MLNNRGAASAITLLSVLAVAFPLSSLAGTFTEWDNLQKEEKRLAEDWAAQEQREEYYRAAYNLVDKFYLECKNAAWHSNPANKSEIRGYVEDNRAFIDRRKELNKRRVELEKKRTEYEDKREEIENSNLRREIYERRMRRWIQKRNLEYREGMRALLDHVSGYLTLKKTLTLAYQHTANNCHDGYTDIHKQEWYKELHKQVKEYLNLFSKL